MVRLSPGHFTLLAALVLAAAGCGGGGDGGLSYDDTGEELAAICEEYDTAAEEEKLTGHAETDAPILREITDQTQAGIAEIRELDVHEELAAKRDEFVATTEESLTRGEVLLRLAEDGKQQAYLKKIREYQLSAGGIKSRTDRLAADLGAPACGQNA